MPALGLGAIVSADLNHALEVDVHAVGELEGLEVGEADDGRARTKVLDLLESAEKLFVFSLSLVKPYRSLSRFLPTLLTTYLRSDRLF